MKPVLSFMLPFSFNLTESEISPCDRYKFAPDFNCSNIIDYKLQESMLPICFTRINVFGFILFLCL